MADENVERPSAVPEAAGADKPPRKVQRQPPTIKPKRKEETKAKGSRLERVKAWSETVLSVVKAVTLLAVTGMIIWIATKVIWHDRGQRRVSFEIDSKVEKLIFDLGVDFDLRAGVRDETNSRIRGVKSFLEAGLFKNIDLGGSQSISFKPFGVEMTATDVTGIARLLVGGAEPAFRVRFELLCDPGPCDSAQPANQKVADRFTRLTLIVNVGGPEGQERLTFPLSTKPAALRRGLRTALQRTAEKLLELADPMVASVLHNNVPFTTNFADEHRHYATRAAGAAFLVRAEAAADRGCLGEIVIGDSLMQRWDFETATQKLDEVARQSGQKLSGFMTPWSRARERTCLIQAKTDQVFFLAHQLCSQPNADGARLELLRKAVTSMDGLLKTVGDAGDIERSRIEELLEYSIFMAKLFINDGEALATAACKFASEKRGTPSVASTRLERATKALKEFRESLPPNRFRQMPVQVVGIFLDYIDQAGPADVVDRLNALVEARTTVDAYLEHSPNPGRFYLVRGRLHREMAATVRDALRLASDTRKRDFVKRWRGKNDEVTEDVKAALQSQLRLSLMLATIAFENASVAVNPFPWLATSPNMEALISIGDMHYADESADKSLDEAERSYASALRLFAEQDAPLREFRMMAKAAARWAAVRKRAGGCRQGSARSVSWDETWDLLGAAPDHDWCAIMSADQKFSVEKLGVLGIVGEYVRGTAKECGQLGDTGSGADQPYGRLDLVGCLERADLKVSNDFFRNISGSGIDQKINQALNAR